MRKITIAVLVLGLLFALSACGNKAEKTAKSFFSALEKQDFQAAKQHATKQSQELLNFAEGYVQSLSQEQKDDMDPMKYKILETKVQGDSAVVSYEQWKASDPGKKETKTMNMVKEDGDWKVQLDKGNVGK